MESPTLSAMVAPMVSVKWLIWAAFNVATILYVAVAYLMFGRAGSMGSMVPPGPQPLAMFVLAAITAIASRRIPKWVMPDRRLHEILTRDPDPESLARNAQTGQVNAQRLQKIKTLAPAEQRLLAASSSLFAPFVVQLAFGEAIALYGLVLSFWSHAFLPVLPFAAIALLLNLPLSPKLAPELERLRKLFYQPSPTRAA
jgi:fatty acid desaturase